MEHFYNFKEILQILNISEPSLRRLVFRKDIPFYKVGGKILFRKSEIEKWLSKKKKGE